MKYGHAVKQSLKELREHPVLLLPSVVSIIITFALFLWALRESGLYTVVITSSASLAAGIDPSLVQEQTTMMLQSLPWTGVLLIFLAMLVANIFMALVLSCMVFTMIRLFKNGTVLRPKVVILETARYLPQYFVLRLIVFIIPVTLALLLPFIVLYVTGNVVFGVFSAALAVVLYLAYIVFYALRLLFVVPEMFVRDDSAVSAVKHTYHLTHHHIHQVLVVALILIAFSIVSQRFVANPLQGSVWSAFFAHSTFAAVSFSVLAGILLLVYAWIATLEHLYIYNAYLDFRKK